MCLIRARSNAGAIRGLRRRRLAIGTVAAHGLLLHLLISAMVWPHAPVAATSLDGLLARYLCSTAADPQHRRDPEPPAHHDPDCPVCGTACPMGCCAPAGPTVAGADAVEPAGAFAPVVFQPQPAIRAARSLYPSDEASQAPPRSA